MVVGSCSGRPRPPRLSCLKSQARRGLRRGQTSLPKIFRASFSHPQPTTAAPTPTCQERKSLPVASRCAVWRRSGDKAPEEPRRDRAIATMRSRKSPFGCLLFPVGYSSDKSGYGAASRPQSRFPVFATCSVVILAHSQIIADQGEKKRRTGIASFIRRGGCLPRLHRRGPLKIHSGPLQPRPEWGGMLEPGGAAPGQKGAIIPSSSEPRRIDTKYLTTDTLLPVWGTREGI